MILIHSEPHRPIALRIVHTEKYVTHVHHVNAPMPLTLCARTMWQVEVLHTVRHAVETGTNTKEVTRAVKLCTISRFGSAHGFTKAACCMLQSLGDEGCCFATSSVLLLYLLIHSHNDQRPYTEALASHFHQLEK